MTSIDIVGPSVETIHAGNMAQVAPDMPAVLPTATSSIPSSAGASTSAVAPQIVALQTSAALRASGAAQETSSSSTEVFRMLGKVVEALASVVQAFMGVMTAFMHRTTGASQGAVTTAGGTTAGATAGAGGSAAAQAGSATGSMFDVTKSDAGMINVRTRDGFLIRAEGKDQAWTITGPDGKTTRIWGDPHVYESDGNKWDFKTRSTFAFGNNKATVEVVPAGNGETLSAQVTIYSGDERVTIDGIDKDKPVITAVSRDGRQHDDALADGITFDRALNSRGESWRSNLTNKIM
jgi:hypothetical protein